jgi:hypothetical protein
VNHLTRPPESLVLYPGHLDHDSIGVTHGQFHRANEFDALCRPARQEFSAGDSITITKVNPTLHLRVDVHDKGHAVSRIRHFRGCGQQRRRRLDHAGHGAWQGRGTALVRELNIRR